MGDQDYRGTTFPVIRTTRSILYPHIIGLAPEKKVNSDRGVS